MVAKKATSMSNQRHIHDQLRILVVEDSEFLQELFRTFLSKHILQIASDIKKGWALYLENVPDVVFMDIKLPDGSGHDLALKIKQHNSTTHIIMATASHDRKDKITAAQTHVDGYITKPFDKKIVNDCVNQFLTSRQDKKNNGAL
jgi:DNA-binding response OmpR family regulator